LAQVVTFGEIMLRLNPPDFHRFVQAETFEVSHGGAEASVATSLVNYGTSAAFVTCLPSHELGQAAVNYLKRYGVDTSHIVRKGERIGIYYLEIGANQRGSEVIYDRSHSAASEIKPGNVPWNVVFFFGLRSLAVTFTDKPDPPEPQPLLSSLMVRGLLPVGLATYLRGNSENPEVIAMRTSNLTLRIVAISDSWQTAYLPLASISGQ
jgi:sugar/nucleoside kinase (ribokinase family)